MALEDMLDDTDDQDSMVANETGFSSRTAKSPVSDQLAGLLEKYLEQTDKAATEKQALLDRARERLMARTKGPDDAEMYFRLAAAFGKPTRTGSFAETLGSVGEATSDILSQRRKAKDELEDLELKYQMAGADAAAEATKAKITGLSTLARAQPKDRLTEIERLQQIIDDPKATAAAKANAQNRIKKLTYIAPPKGTGDGEKPPKAASPAGKIAQDEGLTPGTSEFNTRVKQIVKEGTGTSLSGAEVKLKGELEDKIAAGREVVRAFSEALELNNIAYEGRTSGAREAIGSVIPGVRQSEAQTATASLENVVLGTALTQLKAIFGAAPTEGERKILIDVQGSINKPAKAREAIWKRARDAAARRVSENQRRIKEISSGAYSRRAVEESGADEPEEFAYGGPVRMQEGGELSLANIGRAIGQGAGFGFGDEATARVRAKMEGRPYEEVLAEERAKYEAFVKKNPLTALGTELVSGAIPTAAALLVPGGQPASVVGGARMAQAAKRIADVLPQFAKGQTAKTAGVGLGTGALSGAGSSVEGERGSGAVSGGVTGAVAGPVFAKGVDLVGRGAQGAKNVFRPSQQVVDERATQKVLQAMGRDEMSTSDVLNKMVDDQIMGVRPMLMDVSPSMQSLGEAVVTLPGQGRKILGKELEERLEQGRDVVGQRVSQTIAKGKDFTASEESLMGSLRANANTLYDKAYAHGSVDDTRILKVLEDDTFKSAFREAQRIANKEARAAELRGEDASRFRLQDIYETDKDGNLVSVGKIPDVRTLDYIKRGIDALIDKGYKGEGMSKAEANALKDLRKAYISVIDENVPEYAAARAKYAGDMEVLDALRLGKDDYLKPALLPEQAKKLVAGMSDAEKDALRTGVAQSVLSKIMEAPQQVNAAQRVIGAPATRKRLEALFDTPEEYKIFEAALQREAQLFRNAQDTIRNSRTTNRREALDDLKRSVNVLDVAGEAIDMASGGPGTIMSRTLKYLQSRATIDEKTAAEVAKMLKASSPQEIGQVLDRLEGSAAQFATQQQRAATRGKIISGAVGAAAPEDQPALAPVESNPEETDDEMIERILRESENE
jgi:hypothetical protein